MPDFDKLPRNSKPVTVFNDALKVQANSPFTQAVDIAGSRNIIIMQETALTGTTTRTIDGNSVGWSGTSSVVDDDLSTGGGILGNVPTNSIIVDFQTSVIRQVKAKGQIQVSANISTVNHMYLDFSTSATGPWVEQQTIVALTTSGATGNATNTITYTTSAAFRYARVRAVTSVGADTAISYTCFEVYEGGIGLGTSTLEIEVFDTFRNTWKVLVGTSEFTTMNAGVSGGTKELVQLGMDMAKKYALPTDPSTLCRFKMIVLEGVKTSVQVIRV